MSNGTRKRSRLSAELAPIHVGELLSGAGMTGFLSVLRIPGHLSHSSSAQSARISEKETDRNLADDGAQELLSWFSAKTAAWLDQAACQRDSLLALEASAGRMNQAVQRIYRRTKVFQSGCAQWRSNVPSGKELLLDEQG